MTMAKRIRVHITYFAVFREQSGLSQETLDTGAARACQLFDELSARHGFTLPQDHIRVAINQVFRPMEAPLANGDEVVFVPPVSGG